ncbi:MAG: S8 family serine peptidase [Planctomycetes bacterium]|nr:S8 family serine peptidase [Planctomycetota bacterium]
MVPGQVLVWLDDPTDLPDLTSRGLDLLHASGGPIAIYRPRSTYRLRTLAEGARLEDSSEYATCVAAASLEDVAGIRCANPNYVYQRLTTPNDTHFGKQWHYPLINLPQAWDLTQGSANVIVAVIDTGIVSAHPEFQGRLVAGFDMISDPQMAGDGDGRDANPEDPGDGVGTGQPSSFHGTHVAGTIGANGNDGQGVAGIDWNCKLMPVRVLGRGGGATADIADGILFAAGLANGSNRLPARRADIINLSLGGPGTDPVLEQACNAAAAAGVLLVAAAGNDDSAEPNAPAAFASVLSVGAVDLLRARAPYSNFHSSIDLWAPGGDMTVDRNGDGFADGVLSCMADEQGQHFFTFENGTSMASPHVAGVAALVKARNPALTAPQIRNLLLGTATPVTGLPNQGVLVDALAAVIQASSPPTAPILVARPTAVDFGSSRTQDTIALSNAGAGALTFVSASVDPAAPWLQGGAIAATGGNISHDRFALQADRTGLPDGVGQTRLTLAFTDGVQQLTAEIDVRVQVGGDRQSQDTVFVLLVDADSFATEAQVETDASIDFQYAFGSAPPGTYLLVAGTDRDGDDELGDEGELFGVFPSLDTPLLLEVTAGETIGNLDFALRELIVISSQRPGSLPSRVRRLH